MLIRLSAPQGAFLRTDDVKEHLRVDHSDDDFRIGQIIDGETRRYEEFTGRVMAPSEWEARFDGWCDPLNLGLAPVRSVSEVVYLDGDDAEQTLGVPEWYLEETTSGASVRFTENFSSPDLSSREKPVRVRFEAGYSTVAETGTGANPALDPDPRDRINVILMVQKFYDEGTAMDHGEMRARFSSSRVFR